MRDNKALTSYTVSCVSLITFRVIGLQTAGSVESTLPPVISRMFGSHFSFQRKDARTQSVMS
ncbi:hypothetical protein LZ30DRAFT_729966 [Colletotrichum cereale]|nr:hypothetical protein LZ30DRAFT_729966 [Colletotrichum cereale]